MNPFPPPTLDPLEVHQTSQEDEQIRLAEQSSSHIELDSSEFWDRFNAALPGDRLVVISLAKLFPPLRPKQRPARKSGYPFSSKLSPVGVAPTHVPKKRFSLRIHDNVAVKLTSEQIDKLLE